MEISPLMMAVLLLYSFIFGVFVGLLYDANRIIRVFFGERYGGIGTDSIAAWKLPFLKKTLLPKEENRGGRAIRYVVVFLGDLVCVLCAGIGIIVLNYSYNSGEFRGFTVIGVLAGFLLYRFSVGRITLLFLEAAAMLIKYLFLSFFVAFSYPFYVIGKNIVKKFNKLKFLCTFTLEKRKEKLYNIKEEVYLLKMSKTGFLD